jgi:hypothetical protein
MPEPTCICIGYMLRSQSVYMYYLLQTSYQHDNIDQLCFIADCPIVSYYLILCTNENK